jgi:hypothetical protein
MPVNWDEFEDDIGPVIDEAAARTDERLASRISDVTRLTNAEVLELFPDPADVKKLVELMKIVNSAADRNSKINHIVSRAEDFAGIVVTLLEKLA